MHSHRLLKIIIIVLVTLLVIGITGWRIRVNIEKSYANGAIEEYARVQGLPNKKIKNLRVGWDMKSDDWVTDTVIHVNGKPYQPEYLINRDDVRNAHPNILYSVYKKQGEGWGEISDKAMKRFKYKELYDY